MKGIKYSIYILAALTILACKKHTKVIPDPEIYLSIPDDGYEIDQDSSFTIYPKITYDNSSTYEWKLDEEVVANTKDYDFFEEPLGSYHYLFTVTTPSGFDTMTVPVHSLDIISFEESESLLNDDGYNNSPAEGYFSFKGYDQYSNDNETGQSSNWSGFALSDNTDQSTATVDNELSVYNTSGADESIVFSVFKQSENIEHRISFTDKEHVVKSIQVNNTSYAYLTMSGILFDKKDNVDYLKLTISGYNSVGDITGTIDFYLADYRFETIAERYIVSSWNKIDLTPLGSVKSIGFQLNSSVDSDPELVLPKYFCLDNFKIKT